MGVWGGAPVDQTWPNVFYILLFLDVTMLWGDLSDSPYCYSKLFTFVMRFCFFHLFWKWRCNLWDVVLSSDFYQRGVVTSYRCLMLLPHGFELLCRLLWGCLYPLSLFTWHQRFHWYLLFLLSILWYFLFLLSLIFLFKSLSFLHRTPHHIVFISLRIHTHFNFFLLHFLYWDLCHKLLLAWYSFLHRSPFHGELFLI